MARPLIDKLFRYDFDLKTGKSETGLTACTYSVEVRLDSKDGLEKVFMEAPERGSDWRVVELRPVSEGGLSVFPLCYTISQMQYCRDRICRPTTTCTDQYFASKPAT